MARTAIPHVALASTCIHREAYGPGGASSAFAATENEACGPGWVTQNVGASRAALLRQLLLMQYRERRTFSRVGILRGCAAYFGSQSGFSGLIGLIV